MTDFSGLVDALAAADLPPEERERRAAALRQAAGAGRSDFIAFVRSIPLDEDNSLFEIYETLAGDPDAWGPFILEEMDRIFFRAKSAADPARVLAPLEALAFFGHAGGGSLAARIGARLAEELESPNVAVRRKAAWLAGDFLDDADAGTVAHLCRRLVSDPDWRVRHFADVALTAAGRLPDGYRRPALDRLRAKLLDLFVE